MKDGIHIQVRAPEGTAEDHPQVDAVRQAVRILARAQGLGDVRESVHTEGDSQVFTFEAGEKAPVLCDRCQREIG